MKGDRQLATSTADGLALFGGESISARGEGFFI